MLLDLPTGAALLPNGAIVAQLPTPGLAAGGNDRGANAVDLQRVRSGASDVAGGAGSVIAGGIANRASGAGSAIGGGQNNQTTGTWGTIPGGWLAADNGLYGAFAYASGFFAVGGDAQMMMQVLRRATADATPTRLTADNAAPGLANTFNLPNNSVARGTLLVVGRQNSAAGGRYSIRQDVVIARDASAAATSVTLGTAEVLSIGTVAGWAVALAADTTNGGLSITVTGAVATAINWDAVLIAARVQ